MAARTLHPVVPASIDSHCTILSARLSPHDVVFRASRCGCAERLGPGCHSLALALLSRSLCEKSGRRERLLVLMLRTAIAPPVWRGAPALTRIIRRGWNCRRIYGAWYSWLPHQHGGKTSPMS